MFTDVASGSITMSGPDKLVGYYQEGYQEGSLITGDDPKAWDERFVLVPGL